LFRYDLTDSAGLAGEPPTPKATDEPDTTAATERST
jgi:hypothetical protein